MCVCAHVFFTAFIVYAGETDFSYRFNREQNFSEDTDDFKLSKDDYKVVTNFPSGKYFIVLQIL